MIDMKIWQNINMDNIIKINQKREKDEKVTY